MTLSKLGYCGGNLVFQEVSAHALAAFDPCNDAQSWAADCVYAASLTSVIMLVATNRNFCQGT